MRTSSPSHIRSAPPAGPAAARIALLVDAPWLRGCAAADHERHTGTAISPSRVNIDGPGISRWLADAALELRLPGVAAARLDRPSRRVHDTPDEDRRARRHQRRYHGVLRAEGLVVTCERRCGGAVARPLGRDLVDLARGGEIAAALLIAGDRAHADAVIAARRHGVGVVLLVPPGAAELVAEPLRHAATRVVCLHPEVFETLHHVCDAE